MVGIQTVQCSGPIVQSVHLSPVENSRERSEGPLPGCERGCERGRIKGGQ